MPDVSPDSALVTLLTGSHGLTSGTNLFTGPVRSHGTGVPLDAVFVLATGSREHQPRLGIDKDGKEHAVQVRIRKQRNFTTGQTLARDCITTLHRSTPAGCIGAKVVESHANYLGQDANDCHEWSFNVVVMVAE